MFVLVKRWMVGVEGLFLSSIGCPTGRWMVTMWGPGVLRRRYSISGRERPSLLLYCLKPKPKKIQLTKFGPHAKENFRRFVICSLIRRLVGLFLNDGKKIYNRTCDNLCARQTDAIIRLNFISHLFEGVIVVLRCF